MKNLLLTIFLVVLGVGISKTFAHQKNHPSNPLEGKHMSVFYSHKDPTLLWHMDFLLLKTIVLE